MPLRKLTSLLALGTLGVVPACSNKPAPQTTPATEYRVEEKSLADLQTDLTARRVTAERLVSIYLERIRTIDRAGPNLHSVLSVNPAALDDAKSLDRERVEGHVRGPLHGIPIVLKDNIESADPLPTTAGSLALEKNVTGRDAPIVARLRAAGAIILGKNNLSEWAAIRGWYGVSNGWSAVGGLTVNAYDTNRSACGSSSGSAVAVAANLAAASIGTDTDGSVTCPAAANALVGLRPTIGLVSRRYIVPISAMQDTAGPMARTVADIALLLSVIAGTDPDDPATVDADTHRADDLALLSDTALSGKRLGVVRGWMGYSPKLDAVFEGRLSDLKAAGAALVELNRPIPQQQILKDEFDLMAFDFRHAINEYLKTAPAPVLTRSLDDLIAFNNTHADRELVHFGQDMFERAARSALNPAAAERVRTRLRREAREGLDSMLGANQLDALIAPSFSPPGTLDLINGDQVLGGIQGWHAIAGYPHLTVPMGDIDGLPVGLSFVGPMWSDGRLIAMAYAFERRTRARQPPPFRRDQVAIRKDQDSLSHEGSGRRG
jgi:amidase